ncbi:MAG TPA: acyl-CoA dehydrogenase family protein [Vicinamibacterales bacterium]|nr:acyl-CoA dehydrogenase family protein [Vicinamibacterales bacterium]
MTFDLTLEQQTLVATARNIASLPANAMDAVLVLEERASHDPAGAARFGFEGIGGRSNTTAQLLPGLEGSEAALASISEANRVRARLVAAAVALGVGKAAVAHAIAAMKKTGVKPGPDETAPHWTFADGATDVAAARLLTYDAAQILDRQGNADEAITRAHVFAANAATRAVDAAIKVEGVAGYAKGSLLERLSRDARTLQLILR